MIFCFTSIFFMKNFIRIWTISRQRLTPFKNPFCNNISNFNKKRAQYLWILCKHKSSTLVIFDNNFFSFFQKLTGNISSSCQWKIPEQQVSKLKKKAIFYQFKKCSSKKKKKSAFLQSRSRSRSLTFVTIVKNVSISI